MTRSVLGLLLVARLLFGDPGAVPAEPVDLWTGLFVRSEDDFVLSGPPPIVLTRTYRNRDVRSRPFGIGTSHSYEWFLVGDHVAFTYIDVVQSDGGRLHYRRISPGTAHEGAVFEHTATPTEFYGSRLIWNGHGWEVHLSNGGRYSFRGRVLEGGGPERAGSSKSGIPRVTSSRSSATVKATWSRSSGHATSGSPSNTIRGGAFDALRTAWGAR